MQTEVNTIEAIRIEMPVWNVEEFNGYKPQTNYWDLFSVAEAFGPKEIINVLYECFDDLGLASERPDIKKLTELVMVLNHKIWSHYRDKEPADSLNNLMSRMYNKLWQDLDSWANENIKNESDRMYYFETLD